MLHRIMSLQAVEQKEEYCYIAKELCEYTLEEYIRILHLNRRLDPLCSDRLVWQLLKGLKHLHDNCKIVHHNLRVSNGRCACKRLFHLLHISLADIRLSFFSRFSDIVHFFFLSANKHISG